MAVWQGSPNYGARPEGARVELVVLHYTAMESAEAALERLCDPAHEVSAHYLIGGCGTVWQMVAEADRAWHAGAGSWQGRADVNSRSIGIELANPGDAPFAARQVEALEVLLKDLLARYDLPAHAVIGHSDMAPGRKRDPGARFDWRRLARRGLSVWPGPVQAVEADLRRFEMALWRLGYPAESTVETFRLRFRPWALGAALDGWDVALAEDLVRRLDLGQPSS